MWKKVFVGLVGGMALLMFFAGRFPTPVDPDVVRVRDHLSRVVQTLRETTPADLTEGQRRARRAAIAWLDEYRASGVFPHNHVRANRTSVFVDPHGTPCAVGYLMLRSGEEVLVEELVRTNNLVRVPELEGDARVASWLGARGLTLEEAALIQPNYGPRPAEPAQVSSVYKGTTVGLSLAAAALASYSAMSGPGGGAPWVDALMIGSAVGNTYLLLEARDTDADEPSWATTLNVVGVVASVGGEIFRLVRRGEPNAPQREGGGVFVRPGSLGTEIGFAFRH